MTDLSRIARKILDRKQLERRKNERFRIREKAVAIIKSDPMEECEIALSSAECIGSSDP